MCYRVGVPATANSANGDVYFQISGPSSLRWIALGQGSQMAGANIFVVYASADGNNVTLSPRSARGYVQPEFNEQAQVSLLEGSGIVNGFMTANVRCECFRSARLGRFGGWLIRSFSRLQLPHAGRRHVRR